MNLKIAPGLVCLGLLAATLSFATNGLAEDVPTPAARPTTAPVAKPLPTTPGAKTTAAPAAGIGTAKPAVLPPVTTAVAPLPYGQVYLQRGLINVFSRGMDQIAVKLKQRGIAVAVFNHSYWRTYADQAIARYKTDKSILPIIIVGHSLGADGAVLMANYFGLYNVPVRLVIAFDGVVQKDPVGANVEELINYYKPNEYGQIVKTSSRFHGTITNVDLTKFADIDHLNIDKIEELQDEVILKILDVMKKKPKGAPGTTAKATTAPGTAARTTAAPGTPATGTAATGTAPTTAASGTAAPTTAEPSSTEKTASGSLDNKSSTRQ